MTKMANKIMLLCTKFVPVLVAIGTVVVILLTYFDINSYILDLIFGSSFMAIIPMYVASYTFKFCK